MLAFLGFSMIIVFMYLIISKRMSALVALIVIPILFALFGGFGPGIGEMMLEGVKQVAPTGVMLMFAILYFGIMIDAGLFDPLVGKILAVVKGDPLKIVIGTALLSMMVALDGDGTTTYMITVSAMLPLYQRLGMNPLILTCIAMLSFGFMNMTPWGGPTARAVSALQLDVADVFTPLIPVMAGGALWTLFTAYILGKKERKRIGVAEIQYSEEDKLTISQQSAALETESFKRPKLLWINLLLTVSLLVCLITSVLPLPILFMIAFVIALMINYPKLDDQKERISNHAGNVLAVVGLVFASGIFTGILSGTEMVDEMANSLVAIIPESLGSYFAVITAVTSIPFTYFMANDPYYYGVLPILAQTAEAYGVDPAEIARASILGQPVHAMSPLMASAYLLVGMAGVEFGDHQKFIFKWALGSCFVMIAIALLTGVITF
ncbi:MULTISPECIES: CitMHS family transporter [Bacillus]|uniref:Citrate transporter n=2 Tax=Bacillus TaxID=1386 RepID=A0A0M4FNA5_9BACI|nr:MULTISPECIES: citrate:proton symporter [Bacillus]ALC84029.1 citrate transporter [Bacillus gobiensis]MBP1082870.1 CitMHS family citrate-Mg2+:H+ or citrate-Ca2+:H+ symporter [Bacillus capparidis]MED1098143.1 citrate:proton symporter [Bacillus capparidis]